MTDKQRADHVQASYWNGYLTRTEAQKVFDDTARVIQAQAAAIQKLDAVLSFMAEKQDIKPEEINEWMKKKIEESQKSSLEKAVDKVEESKLVVAS